MNFFRRGGREEIGNPRTGINKLCVAFFFIAITGGCNKDPNNTEVACSEPASTSTVVSEFMQDNGEVSHEVDQIELNGLLGYAMLAFPFDNLPEQNFDRPKFIKDGEVYTLADLVLCSDLSTGKHLLSPLGEEVWKKRQEDFNQGAYFIITDGNLIIGVIPVNPGYQDPEKERTVVISPDQI
ncbi:hypothetical protein H6792_02370 [Candidatus Nomurabacteria bacterium]|nr:hypothetical protein [Candidatus Nomurabacteria bacterium]